jgi:hypothetical protein
LYHQPVTAAPPFEEVDDDEVRELRREIIARRQAGAVRFHVGRVTASRHVQQDEPALVAGAFAERCGLRPGEGLRAVERERGERMAMSILERDLAYRDELMSPEDAMALVRRMMRIADGGVRPCFLFTNGSLADPPDPASPSPSPRSWTPMTGATFDTGLVVVAPPLVSLLWVEDED